MGKVGQSGREREGLRPRRGLWDLQPVEQLVANNLNSRTALADDTTLTRTLLTWQSSWQTFPALFGLYWNGYLPKDIQIIGYARTKMDDEEFHNRIKEHIKVPIPAMRQKLDGFLKICSYMSGQYDQDDSFQELEKVLKEHEKPFKGEERNRIFYMALPPSVFISVATCLKKNNVRLVAPALGRSS